LDGNLFGVDGTEALVASLFHNCSVTSLSMRRNALLADAAGCLARLLSCNANLSHLDLSFNPLGPDGAQNLADGLPQNGCIRRRDRRVEQPGSEVGGGLVHLAMRGCGIQQPPIIKNGVHYLAQGLAANKYLQTLDLAANGLDGFGAQELAHALLKNKMWEGRNL
ncbi:unnamed protein product, partial [Choristocarpus tenellus]